MEKPKVKLIGEDGNAFNILATVQRALKKAGYSDEKINEYVTEATSGDYNKLLVVTAKWVDITGPEADPEGSF